VAESARPTRRLGERGSAEGAFDPGAALLRTFHAEAEADKRRRVVNQVLNAGREALKILWANANK
jgi:hypothetical protein